MPLCLPVEPLQGTNPFLVYRRYLQPLWRMQRPCEEQAAAGAVQQEAAAAAEREQQQQDQRLRCL